MRPKFPVRFRAWCVAVILGWGLFAHAAERHPLLGATREQVLSRNGEPRSSMTVGNRELLFYSRERIALRNGVVVEVERLGGGEQTKRPGVTTVPAPDKAPDTAAPAPPAAVVPEPTPARTSPEAPPPANPLDATSDSKLEIKRVLPRGMTTVRPEPTPPVPEPVAPPAPAGPTVTGPVPAPAVPDAALAEKKAREPARSVAGRTSESPEPEPTPKEDEAAGKKKGKKVIDLSAARRKLEEAEAAESDPTAAIFNQRTYVIALVIIGAGAGFLFWRRRQRRLELEASALSRAPFSMPTATTSGTVFTADLLSKLEWKRFEDLVAAYYNKTGVVATRTKSGPAASVHIKISWKGEPRPFAMVQCIPRATGLIDAKPIQELCTVLAAEDIRRGYVVTTAKFSIPARDIAEEKHITLMPGDMFLEKLNALPDTARAELMQDVTAGDFTTPSCPKCEAKMVRPTDDPTLWRCTAHPDQQITSR